MNNILRCFKCTDITFLLRAFTVYVRPLLESATVVWNPTAKGLITELESVQRQFTRRAFARAGLPVMDYPSRMCFIGFESLERRRIVRDLEFLFQTLHENVLYDSSCVVDRAPLARVLRNSHSMRVRLPFAVPGARRSTFVSRSLKTWNGLDEDMVSDPNVKKFKMRIRNLQISWKRA